MTLPEHITAAIDAERLRWEPGPGGKGVYRGKLVTIQSAGEDERFDIETIFANVFTIRKPGRVMTIPSPTNTEGRIDARCVDLETKTTFEVEMTARIIRFYISAPRGSALTATRLYQLIQKQPGCAGARLMLGRDQLWPA